MNLIKFLASKTFLKHLLIAVGIAILFFAGSFVWLRIYTEHGKTITVPDLTGLTEEEADIILDSKKLRYDITDSIFYKELPRGTIARQNPKPGSKVKENRRIYLVLNAVNPEKVSMPAVTGVSLRQARAILETYGLNLGKISYKPNIAVNVVLEQKYHDSIVDPGTMVVKGSPIDLVLGQGLSKETTEVPDLKGFSLFMAKDFLADRYLNIGAVIYDNSIENEEDSTQAFIWRQRPDYNEINELKLGENVDVWLTIDSTKIPAPDTLNPDYQEEITHELFN